MVEGEFIYRTRSGRQLTEAEIDQLVAESERGYDVDALIRDPELPVGTVLFGFCGGIFGRDASPGWTWRVEASGRDWIVARPRVEGGGAWFASGDTVHDDLRYHLRPDENFELHRERDYG